jgi:hypothetical protein
MNDITLNWKKIGKFARMEDANAGIRQKDRAYTHEEIQTILLAQKYEPSFSSWHPAELELGQFNR